MQKLAFKNGHSMPALGIGYWNVPGSSVAEVTDAAFQDGYRHFDSAYVYKNEKELGVALKNGLKKYNLKREDIFVTSKLWSTMKRPENVRKAFQTTLDELQLDYLDLYLIHWPMTFPHVAEDFPVDATGKTLKHEYVPVGDTWKEMESLVNDGLVKSIGVSNFNRSQLDELLNSPCCSIKPANLQIEMHVNFPNIKLANYATEHGLTVTAYSPLGSPGISGQAAMDETWIKAIATKYGKTPAQILLRYIVQRGYSVIPKSVNPKRIIENSKIFDFELSKDEMHELNTKGTQKRSISMAIMEGHPEYPFAAEY